MGGSKQGKPFWGVPYKGILFYLGYKRSTPMLGKPIWAPNMVPRKSGPVGCTG